MDPLLLQYQQNMDLLNIMISDNDLPEDMRRRLRLYFQESRILQRKVNQQTVVASLSPGLQGELAMKISHDWLQRVWYFDVLETEPIVEISKRLKPMIFASQEHLVLNNNSRTLFIIMRGVVARCGLILDKNTVVGDDMIIASPYLRATAKPICVTFIEVVYLTNEQLNEVREAFPVAETRVRRAQVMWALRRGFVLTAWHRVQRGAAVGPRSTDYFKREVPSFTTLEAAQEWSEVAAQTGSLSIPSMTRKGRRVSMLGGQGLCTGGPRADEAQHGRVPQAAHTSQALAGLFPPPRAAKGAEAQGSSEVALIGALQQMRQEVQEGLAHLETRIERVERRVNPNMLTID